MKTTTTGFEPVREYPNGFRVRLLNHSDKLSYGEAGHRSQYLTHAKRALYHLSYIPKGFVWGIQPQTPYKNDDRGIRTPARRPVP